MGLPGHIDALVRSARERARKLPERVPKARPERPSFVEAVRGKAKLDVIAEYKQNEPESRRHRRAQLDRAHRPL